jgi:hypothetical protein
MRCHDFDGDQSIQFLLKSLEYNPVRALTNELPDFDIAESSEESLFCVGCRKSTIKSLGFSICPES